MTYHVKTWNAVCCDKEQIGRVWYLIDTSDCLGGALDSKNQRGLARWLNHLCLFSPKETVDWSESWFWWFSLSLDSYTNSAQSADYDDIVRRGTTEVPRMILGATTLYSTLDWMNTNQDDKDRTLTVSKFLLEFILTKKAQNAVNDSKFL